MHQTAANVGNLAGRRAEPGRPGRSGSAAPGSRMSWAPSGPTVSRQREGTSLSAAHLRTGTRRFDHARGGDLCDCSYCVPVQRPVRSAEQSFPPRTGAFAPPGTSWMRSWSAGSSRVCSGRRNCCSASWPRTRSCRHRVHRRAAAAGRRRSTDRGRGPDAPRAPRAALRRGGDHGPRDRSGRPPVPRVGRRQAGRRQGRVVRARA